MEEERHMGKLKSHRGAAKRFKFTATGKVKMSSAGMRHLLTGKTARKKRSLGQSALVDKANIETIKKLLPYG